MPWSLPDEVQEIMTMTASGHSPLHDEMAVHGAERGFPIVGPQAGAFLSVLSRAVGARSVFEFGSGFGYSAAWFLDAIPDDGSIVLTDYDADNLDQARAFLGDHPSAATVRYEVGDAMETFATSEGVYDVIFIDHDKSSYPDAFDLVESSLTPGGLLIADNILAGPVTPEGVLDALRGTSEVDESTAGIAGYLQKVREAPSLSSVVAPIGNGLAISYRVPPPATQ